MKAHAPKDTTVAGSPISGAAVLGGTAGSRITHGRVFDAGSCFDTLRLRVFVVPCAMLHESLFWYPLGRTAFLARYPLCPLRFCSVPLATYDSRLTVFVLGYALCAMLYAFLF